jgi:putative transposase
MQYWQGKNKKLKSYRYRIYPTKSQVTLLEFNLYVCRTIYNWLLDAATHEYKNRKHTMTRKEMYRYITIFSETWDSLTKIHSQLPQNAADRLHKAMANFFRRVRNKPNPAYPRFKSYNSYVSFTYPQSGFSIDSDGKLYLSKIGHIKIKQHRPIVGDIKTCNVKRKNNKWYVSLSAIQEKVEPKLKPIDIEKEKIPFLLNKRKKSTNKSVKLF